MLPAVERTLQRERMSESTSASLRLFCRGEPLKRGREMSETPNGSAPEETLDSPKVNEEAEAPAAKLKGAPSGEAPAAALEQLPNLEDSEGLRTYRKLDKQQRRVDEKLSDEMLLKGPAAGKQLISSEEALQRIAKGEQLSGVAVRTLRLSGEFAKNILLRQSYIHQLELIGFTAKQNVSFLNCEFKRVHVERSVFQGSLSLKNSQAKTLAILQMSLSPSPKL